MPGVLDGLNVLDLSWGVAGPITAMLLADQGARVTKIEPPGGDPFRSQPGHRVWNRGKRSAVIDLKTAAGRDSLLGLAAGADVLIETFSPGTMERLGAGAETVLDRNPRLIHCSITGYGRESRHNDRPAYDALVAARIGYLHEQRGWWGGSTDRLSGRAMRHPDLEIPADGVPGALRPGPLFAPIPWASMGASYLASSGISAALLAREVTGRGQRVETSLLQGAMASCLLVWQRVENPDAKDYWAWISDMRSPKGMFQCADGRWVMYWPMNPGFVQQVSAGDELRIPDNTGLDAHQDPVRLTMSEDDMVLAAVYFPEMAAAFARFPSDEWVAMGAKANVGLQPIRSPEEALADPLLLADGCVAEVDDAELGAIRHVGRVYELTGISVAPLGRAPRLGEHTDEVLAEAGAARTDSPSARSATAPSPSDFSKGPLTGVTVLDLGLAMAGPFGTQVLASLGADVIKVNALYDGFWHRNQVAMACNRGKRSIVLNLKDERGLAVLHDLVARADVVHHNMRYEAAIRLGVDYESLKAINPQIVYCHTRGFERGEREVLPGNDQVAGALAGTLHEVGGTGDGGRPYWSLTSLGDTGNGFLSAIAVMQALYHRRRTGKGQKVGTSIIYAHLLNASNVYLHADGSPSERARLDGDQLGVSPRYRLYETADGWLCVAAVEDGQWKAMTELVGATEGEAIEAAMRTKPSNQWFDAFDAAGVPCEVASGDFPMQMFEDPELVAKRWVASHPHPDLGRLDTYGVSVDFSETPAAIVSGPLLLGEYTREIMSELGYSDERIQELLDAGVAASR